MKTILSATAILVSVLALAFARDGREQARIDFLIREVENAKDLIFIRNGAEHDAAAAGKHLRMKLNYAGERVRTAEEFVKNCASESSLTHRKYKVRFPGGKTMDAAEYFADKLREYDAARSDGAQLAPANRR